MKVFAGKVQSTFSASIGTFATQIQALAVVATALIAVTKTAESWLSPSLPPSLKDQKRREESVFAGRAHSTSSSASTLQDFCVGWMIFYSSGVGGGFLTVERN